MVIITKLIQINHIYETEIFVVETKSFKNISNHYRIVGHTLVFTAGHSETNPCVLPVHAGCSANNVVVRHLFARNQRHGVFT